MSVTHCDLTIICFISHNLFTNNDFFYDIIRKQKAINCAQVALSLLMRQNGDQTLSQMFLLKLLGINKNKFVKS